MSVSMKITHYDRDYEHFFIMDREFTALSKKMNATPHFWPVSLTTHREILKSNYYSSKKIDLIKEYENALASHIINVSKIISLRLNIDDTNALEKASEAERDKINIKFQVFFLGKETSQSILSNIPVDIFKCIFHMNLAILNSATCQLKTLNKSYDYEVSGLSAEIEMRLRQSCNLQIY